MGRQEQKTQSNSKHQPKKPSNTTFERQFWEQGMDAVAGLDEAGRGCLAGPVVAAAVILPCDVVLPGVTDSKKLSAKKREELFPRIQAAAIAYGVGVVGPDVIDEINILQAARRAMAIAVAALAHKPQQLLIDGNQRIDSVIPQLTIIQGDDRSLSIAAASIIAKVTRDRMMVDYDAKFMGYSFGVHKGYGTRRHLDELATHGVTTIHRKTFAPVRRLCHPEGRLTPCHPEGTK